MPIYQLRYHLDCSFACNDGGLTSHKTTFCPCGIYKHSEEINATNQGKVELQEQLKIGDTTNF